MTENKQKDQNVNQFNKFLQNNSDFLQQKYDQYFKKPTIVLKDLNKQSAIKYIYDVFSFNKYESDEKMNNTLQKSLLKNIEDYVAGLAKKKLQFNNKTAVQLLKFCIENNQMFAVKYDKKQKKMKTQEHKNQSTFTEKQQRGQSPQKQIPQNHQQEQKHQSQADQKQKEQHHEEQAENKSQNIEQNPSHVNQFEESAKGQVQKHADPDVIKKNLKLMFQFYCKQQQNVGAHTTFDRISYECKTMTLGKFLAFAGSTGIINQKIDKNLLMRKFKLVAEGKKEIEFEQFHQIIQTLATIDEAMIPKLGVEQKICLRNKLKERVMAFNTKDQSSRQVKRDYIFVPKLTQHSGKLSDALQQQIKVRKMLKQLGSPNHSKIAGQTEQVNIKTPLSHRYESGIKNPLKEGSQIISSPTQLTNSTVRDFQEDLGFLEKMINVEQADDQWLKQYKIPHKKVTTALPPRLMSRKQSIVPNLKKRVEELERSETRQTVHLERRQYMSNNRQRQRNAKSILG